MALASNPQDAFFPTLLSGLNGMTASLTHGKVAVNQHSPFGLSLEREIFDTLLEGKFVIER